MADEFNIIDLMTEWFLEQGFNINYHHRKTLSASRLNGPGRPSAINVHLAYGYYIGFCIDHGWPNTLNFHRLSGALDPTDPKLFEKLEKMVEYGPESQDWSGLPLTCERWVEGVQVSALTIPAFS